MEMDLQKDAKIINAKISKESLVYCHTLVKQYMTAKSIPFVSKITFLLEPLAKVAMGIINNKDSSEGDFMDLQTSIMTATAGMLLNPDVSHLEKYYLELLATPAVDPNYTTRIGLTPNEERDTFLDLSGK